MLSINISNLGKPNGNYCKPVLKGLNLTAKWTLYLIISCVGLLFRGHGIYNDMPLDTTQAAKGTYSNNDENY